jgi:hypothetical protein
MPEALTAPHVLEYPYTRSTGEVIGRFFAGLRERRILGIRARDGPGTGDALDEFVEVADAGVVTSWTWVAAPRPKHLLQHPFAFALVQLDGAATAMLHYVDAGDPVAMKSGMRVRARWKNQPEGDITDIICFEPEVA